MKMDVDEFGKHARDLARRHEAVAIIEGGRVVGHYLPVIEPEVAKDLDGWLDARARFRARWMARTPDWRERLAQYGLDDEGEPFEVELPRFPE